MMRLIEPKDTPDLLNVCKQAGVFTSDDMPTLQKLFDDYHEKDVQRGHLAFAEEEDGKLVGIVYLTPKELTDRTWELLMIMVIGHRQGHGIGTSMLLEAENQLRKKNGRLMLIETMSIPELEQTRLFYRKNGYTEVAMVPDYYATGAGKITFLKYL